MLFRRCSTLVVVAIACSTTVSAGLVGCATGPDDKEEKGMEDESTDSDGETSSSELPETRRQDLTFEMHGTEVSDPYRWLEPNDDEAVREWMEKQNEYTRGVLDGIAGRSKLRERYKELMYVDDVSAPTRRGGRMFYSRQHPDRQKDVYYWRSVDAPAEEETVLLDPNEMGGETNIAVGAVAPSWDGKKVAYTLKKNNRDRATLYVKDVASGEVSDVDVIEGARWADPAWRPDGEGFYYTHYPTDSSIPKAQRPGEADLRYHEFGTESAEDEVVRGPTGDPRTIQAVDLSRDGRWLFAYVFHGWNRADVYYRDLERDGDEGDWQTLVEGRDHKYSVTAWKGDFYIKTDQGAARDRLMKVDAESPAPSNWEELVAEADAAVLDGFRIVGGRLLLKYMEDAQNRLEIREPDGTRVGDVALPGMGTVYGIGGQPSHEEAYVTYESFKTPKRIYRAEMATGETDLWSEQNLPVDTSDLRVEQVWYESDDGTEVSMYLVSKGEIERDGETPVLMYGYGGFNVSLTPYFVEGMLPWLEAGGAFAMPNLRGGGEYGESWHRAGMLEKKQNVFDDFIAAGEYLVDAEITRPEKLAIEGGSNGGLLVSAVATQRPELFGAVICSVPLTDMVRYDEFGPAKVWINEYGDPSNPEHFEFLHAYSPYHNVEKGADYPATLMMSSASDDRVHPMHARKMTAQLQWANAGDEPILFRLEKEAGHGGADRTASRVEKATDQYAFLFEVLDVEKP